MFDLLRELTLTLLAGLSLAGGAAAEAEVAEVVDAGPVKDRPARQSPQLKAVEFGECSRAVERAQRQLVRLRYLPRKAASGCYDETTRHAVMALQKWEGLERDGVLGPKTARALQRAERPDPGSGAERRIDVLLDKQLALVVDGGRLRYAISISSGAPGHETPPGTFAVYRKEEMSWSVPYETWMPWASYFTGGVALHESPDVPGYPASHGCVRVPEAWAEWLYGFAGIGTEVNVRA